MTAEVCPAVHVDAWGVVRCTKPAGHPPTGGGRLLPVVWHSGSGRYIDEDGEPEVYGCAWRYMLALPAGASS